MKKYSIVTCLCLVLILALAACHGGSFSVVAASEINTSHKMSMTYSKFNGNKYTKIDLDAGIVISAEIVSTSGSIQLLVTDKDGNEIFNQSQLQTGSYTVNIEKVSKYTIKVIAENAYGSYSITW